MPVRFIARRLKYFFIYRVLHVDDTPHRIALGVAVGIFVTWTPTIGFQMLLTVALSWLLGANKFVGVPFVWISNLVTIIPIYKSNCWVGRHLLPGDWPAPDFYKVLRVGGSWWLEVWVNRIQASWEATWPIFPPLWLGSLMVGLVLGFLTYFAVLYAVVAYRKRRHRKHPSPAMPEHALPIK